MNKEDRRFIKGLIGGLDQKISGIETGLGEKITGLDQKISSVETNLGKQIRYNGILIEKMQDDVGQMKEGFSVFGKDMSQAKDDIAEIKEVIYDYPILRETVKKHSRQLAELRK